MEVKVMVNGLDILGKRDVQYLWLGARLMCDVISKLGVNIMQLYVYSLIICIFICQLYAIICNYMPEKTFQL